MRSVNFVLGDVGRVLSDISGVTERLWILSPHLTMRLVQAIQRWRLDHAPFAEIRLLFGVEAIGPDAASDRNRACRMAAAQGWECRELAAWEPVDVSIMLVEGAGLPVLVACPPQLSEADPWESAWITITGSEQLMALHSADRAVRKWWEEARPVTIQAEGISDADRATPTISVKGSLSPLATAAAEVVAVAPTESQIDPVRAEIAHRVLARAELVVLSTELRNTRYPLRPERLGLQRNGTTSHGPVHWTKGNHLQIDLYEPGVRSRLKKLLEGRKDLLRQYSVTTDFGRLLPMTAKAEWVEADEAYSRRFDQVRLDLPKLERARVEARLRAGLQQVWKEAHPGRPPLALKEEEKLVRDYWAQIEQRPLKLRAVPDVREFTPFQRFLLDPASELPQMRANREQVIVSLLAAWAAAIRHATLEGDWTRADLLNAYHDSFYLAITELQRSRDVGYVNNGFRLSTLRQRASEQLESIEQWPEKPFDQVLCEFHRFCLLPSQYV